MFEGCSIVVSHEQASQTAALRRQNKRFIIRADSIACKCKPIVCANGTYATIFEGYDRLYFFMKDFPFSACLWWFQFPAQDETLNRLNLEIYNKINYVQ